MALTLRGDFQHDFCLGRSNPLGRHGSQAHSGMKGAEPPREVVSLGNYHIHLIGRVADILPYHKQCSVCIVPLRAGGAHI